MGGRAHLQLDSTSSTRSADTPADAQAKRHRGMADDVEDRVETVQTTSSLKR